MVNNIKNKKGMASLLLVVLASVMVGITTASLTSWYLSVQNNVSSTKEKMTGMTVAKNEWEKISHMSIKELQEKKETFKNPYVVGDYTVQVNLGKEGQFKNGKCDQTLLSSSGNYTTCFDDTTIIVSKDGKNLYTTRTMPLMTDNYSREDLTNLMRQYVKNGSADKGEMVLKGEENNDGKIMRAYLAGEKIPFYSTSEVIGPPNMSARRNISLPFLAEETGYIFIHQNNWEQTKINIKTKEGEIIDGVLNFNYPGMMWIPINKGDYAWFVKRQSAINMIFFIPCMKIKN